MPTVLRRLLLAAAAMSAVFTAGATVEAAPLPDDTAPDMATPQPGGLVTEVHALAPDGTETVTRGAGMPARLMSHAPHGSNTAAVPYSDNRHWGRESGNQTPVWVRIDESGIFYETLIENAVHEWTKSSNHAVYYIGKEKCPRQGFIYEYCVTVAHAGNYQCSSGQTYTNAIESFGHWHLHNALVAVNLSSACGHSLGWAQFVMCHEVGHAMGLNHAPTEAYAPCSGSTKPLLGDIGVLNFLGAHTHPGSLHLVNGVG